MKELSNGVMYISPNLLALCGGALLLLVGKCWATRCYYHELRSSNNHRAAWHSDPTLDYPDQT